VSGPIEIILILAAVCYVMVRRMIGEPAEAKRMLILPAVLLVIGLTNVSHDATSVVPILFLVGSGAISVVIGALRGLSVRLSDRGGLAFVQYTWVTVTLWVANLVIKFGGNILLRVVDPHAAAAVGNSLLLTLGAGLLVEGLVVLVRVLRTDSQVIWSKGKNGEPHRTSPFLDGLRDNLNGRGTGAGADPRQPGQDRDHGTAAPYQPADYDPFHRDAPASWSDDPFPSAARALRDARRDRHAGRRARRDLRR
jgi:hypothetical protein